ncbi:winged helix DNA-binding domain-containing protein [Kitasatospora sp. NPDC051853]|uniref:winged helix DNA-binding domain-containing protein n=1 Tax=Kitasatospora sp. NPDC051853 TaxID=3364058 RepID=UPI0037893430
MTSDDELLRWRMHSQFRDGGTVAAVAGRAPGIQAQDAAAARLGLRARGLTEAAAVERAYADGEVVASWLMRGTLHLVPREQLPSLLALFGERNIAAGARRRRELGLTEEVLARAERALPEVLTEPLGRAELVARLNGRGVGVEPTGQAPAHLTAYLAGRGLLCRGAEVAPREPGYVPLTVEAVDPEEAAAGLAARYVAAFGPVSVADFAAWSGLPQALGKRAFAGLPEVADGLHATGEAPGPGGPVVRLLGAYDNYLLGYRDRSLMLDQRFAKRVNAGGGVVRPTLVVDGRVRGTWARGKDGRPVVEPFEPLPEELWAAEAGAVAEFLG